MTSWTRRTAPFAALWLAAVLGGACAEDAVEPSAPEPQETARGPALLDDDDDDDDDDFDRTEVLVRLAPGIRIGTVNDRYGTTTLEGLPNQRIFLLRLPAGRTLEDLLAEMASDPNIAVADPNRRLEAPEAEGTITRAFADPSLEPADYQDQAALDRIRARQAWGLARGAGVLVAVLDTGVEAGHPLLGGRVASSGWDFVDGDGDPSDAADGLDSDGDGLVDEALGHGTFASGLVLAVAPRSRILPLRVLDSDGVGTAFAVAQGIDRAIARGARVINMSFGMTSSDDVVEELIEEASEEGGIVFVASGGNRNVGSPPQFPAAGEEVLGVAATDRRDRKASFSNYGTWLGVSAPGVGLVAPWSGGGLATWSGTSFAAALTSGEAALLVSARPGAPAERVVSAIRLSAVTLADARLQGVGRINVLAGVKRILASGGGGGGDDGGGDDDDGGDDDGGDDDGGDDDGGDDLR